MAEITIDAIKKLKELSGVGLTDAKRPLLKLKATLIKLSRLCAKKA